MSSMLISNGIPTNQPTMEIEPEKFWPQYKVHKIFGVGG